MTISNKFQVLTNVRKNFNFLCGGDSRYPSVDTEIRKDSQKYGQCSCKNREKVHFWLNEICLAGLLVKKRTSFPSKICPVF